MARRFNNIPNINTNNDKQVLSALGEAVGYITGQTQPLVTFLPSTATLAQTIAKLNELMARLQGTNPAP